jgi:hypothetical protein
MKRHKELHDAINELLTDFIDHSGVPAHQATVHQLLSWSGKQRCGPDHLPDGSHE